MEPALEGILGAAGWLEGLSAGRMGPASRSVMVAASSTSRRVTVTSCSSRLHASIVAPGPLEATLLALVRGHSREHGDQGHLCSLLCARLVREARSAEGALAGMRAHTARAAIQRARNWLREYLSGEAGTGACGCWVAMPIMPSSGSAVRGEEAWAFLAAVARGVIAPKRVAGLGQEELEHVCGLVVASFINSSPLSTFPPSSPHDAPPCFPHAPLSFSSLPPPPRVLGVPGPGPLEGRTLAGVVLRARMHTSCSMDGVRGGGEGGLVRVVLASGNVGGGGADGGAEEWGWLWRKGCVDLLVCQKRVGGVVREGVHRTGGACIERVSPCDMELLHTLSKAVVLHCPPAPNSQPPEGAVGSLGRVASFRLVGEAYLHLGPAPGREGGCQRTVVVCQKERVALEELEECVRNAARVVSSLVRGGRGAVAGGGCFEVHCGCYLRGRAERERRAEGCSGEERRELAGVECVAECIEAAAAALHPLRNLTR